MSISNQVRLWQAGLASLDVGASFAMSPWISNASIHHPEYAYPDGDVETPDSPEFPPPDLCDGPFVLRPQTQRYLLGLLAETETDGKTVLGLTDYLTGGHKGISATIEAAVGPIHRFLWGGELLFANTASDTTIAQLVAINETSGFLRSKRTGVSEKPPSNAHLLEFVRSGSPFVVAENVHVFPFDPQHQHLFEDLNGWTKKLENVRHAIGTFLQGAGQILHVFNASGTGAMENLLARNLVVRADTEATAQLCRVLTVLHLGDVEAWRRLAEGLDLLLSPEPKAYAVLEADFKRLNAFYFTRMLRNEGNQYDLLVR